MANGEKRVVVDIKDVEDDRILCTDQSGSQTTLYPLNIVGIGVHTIGLDTELRGPRDGSAPPAVVTAVRGTALLDDRSISVIGAPASTARELRVVFMAADSAGSLAESRGGALTGKGEAYLDFNGAEWWVTGTLHEAFFDALVTAVRSGQVDSVSLQLALRGLYTKWPPLGLPPLRHIDLFIRPNRRDNSREPETVCGSVSGASFTLSPWDLRKPGHLTAVEPEGDDDENEGEPAAPPPDPVAVAIATLCGRLDQLRSTLKWIGGLVVVALFFVAGR